ncbi:hypothetical protein EYC84_005376 [Monilinia fructicola]|uniref:Uncharacterized protein n=1 Tax=Monilinia fructicola TaxID=38448 RepID=A0A5M9JYT7_MONFR|nr:hypothetical protein EYC84_005376 [Monilinia fructicola]
MACVGNCRRRERSEVRRDAPLRDSRFVLSWGWGWAWEADDAVIFSGTCTKNFTLSWHLDSMTEDTHRTDRTGTQLPTCLTVIAQDWHSAANQVDKKFIAFEISPKPLLLLVYPAMRIRKLTQTDKFISLKLEDNTLKEMKNRDQPDQLPSVAR